MSPPKEKAALQGGLFNSENYDKRNVARGDSKDKPLPRNVQALTAAGVKFAWRESAGDVFTSCPMCLQKLALHESEPWHICLGEFTCRATAMPFNELLAAIGRARQ